MAQAEQHGAVTVAGGSEQAETIRAHTAGRGVDAVFDFVGTKQTIALAAACAAWQFSTVVGIGAGAATRGTSSAFRMRSTFSSCNLLGAPLRTCMRWWRCTRPARSPLPVQRFSLDHAVDAYRMLQARELSHAPSSSRTADGRRGLRDQIGQFSQRSLEFGQLVLDARVGPRATAGPRVALARDRPAVEVAGSAPARGVCRGVVRSTRPPCAERRCIPESGFNRTHRLRSLVGDDGCSRRRRGDHSQPRQEGAAAHRRMAYCWGRWPFQQVAIMRDDDQGSRPGIQRILHRRQHVRVHVVRRLVQGDHVGFTQQQQERSCSRRF